MTYWVTRFFSCFMEQKSLRQWQWQPRLDWCLVNSDLLTTITLINCHDKLSSSSGWIGATVESQPFLHFTWNWRQRWHSSSTVAHAAEEVGHYNISDDYLYLVSDLSILNTSCHVLIIIRRSTLSSKSEHYQVITHSDTSRQQPVRQTMNQLSSLAFTFTNRIFDWRSGTFSTSSNRHDPPVFFRISEIFCCLFFVSHLNHRTTRNILQKTEAKSTRSLIRGEILTESFK